MKTTTEKSALIVGAGPTGLVMASELTRHGIHCRIIDKAAHPSLHSKALGIQARTLEVFANMGIAQEFLALGLKVPSINVYGGAKRLLQLDFSHLNSHYPYMLVVPQNETERLLTGHLRSQGVEIEREVKLTHFTQGPRHANAEITHADGRLENFEFNWILGCDGAHSSVRKILNVPFEGTDSKLHFLLADLRMEWSLATDQVYIFSGHRGLMAVFPIGGGRYRLIADNPTTNYIDDHVDPPLEEFVRLAKERMPVEVTLSDPIWMSNFKVHSRMVSELREGHVFLAGDAAHIHSPAGAQGMNTGIQDAHNLAWKLGLAAKGLGGERLLESYNEERYPVELNVLRTTDTLIELGTSTNPFIFHLRNLLMPWLSHIPALKERLATVMSELSIGYEKSPIVETHFIKSGVRGGDRIQDAPLFSPANQSVSTLLSVAAQPAHTLILVPGTVNNHGIETLVRLGHEISRLHGDWIKTYVITPAEVIQKLGAWTGETYVDLRGTFTGIYGFDAPSVLLIRPDGYIGFRSSLKDDGGALRKYLKRFTKPRAAPTGSVSLPPSVTFRAKHLT